MSSPLRKLWNRALILAANAASSSRDIGDERLQDPIIYPHSSAVFSDSAEKTSGRGWGSRSKAAVRLMDVAGEQAGFTRRARLPTGG